MPWSKDNLPPSVEKMNLTDKEKEQFVEVANSVLKETGDEGRAIASGLATIKKDKESKEDLERKDFTFEVKTFDEKKGTFEGYASIFGNKDSYNDIVVKGAFLESLQKRKPHLLWQHKIDEPIGVYTEVYEDDKGLMVKGQLEIESDFGKRIYNLLKMGSLNGLSVGYRTLKREYDEEKNIRYLKELDLFEVSLVTMPANQESLIRNVKSIEQFTCMKDCENFLKSKGLNNNERKTFISRLKEFSKKRDVEEQDAKKRDAEAKNKDFVLKSLENFIKQLKEKNG